ncbi:MAG: radical SAM protein [Nanobdellota archaeon]
MVLDELQVSITNVCDVGCNHCHLDKSKKNHISKITFLSTLDFAKKNKINTIRLTGGDIFEHPQLFFFLEKLKSNGFTVINNISIKKIDKVENILHYSDYLLISFNCLEELKNPKLPEIAQKTKMMGTAVFNKYWLDNITKLSMLENIGFYSFFFLRNVCKDSESYYRTLNLGIKKISSLNKKKNLKITFSNAFPLCLISNEDLNICSGGKFDNGLTRIYVDTSGNIKPSAYSSINLGKIDSLSDMKFLDKHHSKLPKCENCCISDKCSGGIITNQTYKKDPLQKYTYFNKYTTTFQEATKKYLLKTNFLGNLELLYHKTSGFHMNYPSPDYWKEDTLSLEQPDDGKLNIYIHFPFCIRQCRFCRIPKINNENKEKYIEDLIKEIDQKKNLLEKNKIESIYFGGGSPQLMGKETAQKIITKIFSHIKNNVPEITFELFPQNFDKDLMTFLKNYITRLSIGVQCFNEELLKKMNRKVSANEIKNFIDSCRNLGYNNINFDLIYGLYLENEKNFEKELKDILSKNPEQITYQPLHYANSIGFNNKSLMIEPKINRLGRELLKSYGYTQTTAEDFTKKGEFLYQKNLLQGKNILGFGDKSFSFINNKYFQKRNEKNYTYKLSGKDLLYRKLFFESRFGKIDIVEINKEFNINYVIDFSDSLKYLLRKNYVKIEKNNLIITNKGKNYVDMIANILSLNNLDYKK